MSARSINPRHLQPSHFEPRSNVDRRFAMDRTVSHVPKSIVENCSERSLDSLGSTNKGVVEHEKLPNRGDITASETRVENRQVQNANTSRALVRVGVRRTAQNARRRSVPVARRRRAGCAPRDALVARRKTHRFRAGRRAGFAPKDTPFARRKTCRLHAARRAGCAPQDAPVAHQKTRLLRAGKRAGCTPQDVPVARRKTCRERAVCAPCARHADAQIRPAVRSGLSLLAQVSQNSAVGPRAGGGTPGVAPRSTGRPPRS